jgi:hypothetical protein
MNKKTGMKFFSLLGVLLLTAQLGMAQLIQLTDSVETYGDDVKELMRKARDSTSVKIGDQFAAVWQDALSDSQKDTIMAISDKMVRDKYSLRPSFAHFYGAINAAVDSARLSPGELDAMLSMIRQTTLRYNQKAFNHMLVTLHDLFIHQYIYRANYNQVKLLKGDYSFGFVAPPEETPLLPEASPDEPVASQEEDSWSEDNGWGDGAWGEGTDDGWGSTDGTATEDDGWGSGDEDWGWNDGSETTTEEETADTDAALSVTEYLVQEVVEPEVVGPVITFEHADFAFTTTFDSANLLQTKGELMLHRQLFVGEGGKFDWVAAGLSPDSVFYTFDTYHFDIRIPQLEAENGHMTYIGKVDEPVQGKFAFASKKHSSTQDATYPRFISYNSNIPVRIFNEQSVNENQVIYQGGFSLSGSTITSASIMEGPATVMIEDRAKQKVKAVSGRFSIGDSLILSPKASVVIYQRNDSIFHPAVRFKYEMDSSRLTILRLDGDYKLTPFTSTHLDMDIRADIMRWDLRTDSLEISTLTARDKVPVVFESHSYFDEREFGELSRMYSFHPLIMAVTYGRKNNTLSYYTYDMARDLGQKEQVVSAAMRELKFRGFVEYDEASGLVTLKKKAIHYVLAKARRVDYDNLMMPSYETNGPNAVIRLDSKEIAMRGISQFKISENLNVSIEPDNDEVVMLGERNFRFDGKLRSGNFEFVGEGFTFNYDSFKIELPKIDSISFYLADEEGNQKKVDNTLQSANQDESFIEKMGDGFQQTSGTLYINDPKNKAAQKSLPDYPKFDAENGAIVYFDNPRVLNGAYDKSVYFVIPPFDIDSLSNADPSSIGFSGTLYSDIFPPVDETLRVMPDNSLGFEHDVKGEGYAMYGKTATYHNKLKLDANGLRGEGSIDFLTSTLESEDFVFYMDSVTTVGLAAEIGAGSLGSASFPQAYVEDFTMLWLPRKDSMAISNNDKPFEFYNQTASLDGMAVITEKGLRGNGTLFTRGSEASSEDMEFQQARFSAHNAQFEIKSNNPEKPALAGDDVFLDFKLDENIATVSPEVEGVAAIDFPYAQFKTSITNAVWDLEKETISMSKPDDIPIESSYFYATREDLDSLSFNAEEAVYNIPLQQLDIYGVPYIVSADAKVIPENNQLQILENARFETFRNAVVVVDTLNEYHRLINGTIDIMSRNEFQGKAFYELVANADTFLIEMSGFRKDTVQERRRTYFHTIADGRAEAAQNIIISPGMLFRGDVRMHAAKEALELDGEVKLDFKRVPDYDKWIAYASDAGDKQLTFDYEQALTSEGEPLTAGIHLSSRDNSVYSTFVMDRQTPADYDLFKPKGQLFYDAERREYNIRNPRKDERGAIAGEIFTYNEEKQQVSFEGPFSFMPSQSESFTLESAVIGEGKLETGEYDLNAFMLFNIDLPAQAVLMMGEDLNEALNKSGAQSATSDRTTLIYKLAELIGDEAARDWDQRSVRDYVSLVSMSGKMEQTMAFADVDMKWSPEHKAWYNTSSLGLSNVLEQDVNGSMTGFLEIKPLEMGTMVNLFMQATPDSWYFFSYQNNRLAVWAYNEDFCDIIGSRSKIGKVDGGEYAFFLSDIAETLKYVNRFRKDYLGIEEQYNFNTAAPVMAGEEETEEDKEADRDGF